MHKTLRALGRLLDLDCGDNSCVFAGSSKGGMRTNGGCRCDVVTRVAELKAGNDHYRAYREEHIPNVLRAYLELREENRRIVGYALELQATAQEIEDAVHVEAMEALNHIAKLSDREKASGNREGCFAVNRVWHALNNKEHRKL